MYKDSHEPIKGMLYIESIDEMLFITWNVTTTYLSVTKLDALYTI